MVYCFVGTRDRLIQLRLTGSNRKVLLSRIHEGAVANRLRRRLRDTVTSGDGEPRCRTPGYRSSGLQRYSASNRRQGCRPDARDDSAGKSGLAKAISGIRDQGRLPTTSRLALTGETVVTPCRSSTANRRRRDLQHGKINGGPFWRCSIYRERMVTVGGVTIVLNLYYRCRRPEHGARSDRCDQPRHSSGRLMIGIGINSAKISQEGVIEGFRFAIPMCTARPIL